MSDAGSIGLSPQQQYLRLAPSGAPGVALRAEGGADAAGGGRTAAGAPGSALRRTQQTFGEAMSIAGRALDQRAGDDRAAQARDAAAQFVAQVLVQPLMKQMRSSSWAAAPFAPSRMEQQFRSMMDATVAIDAVRAGDWPLVERLAKDMERRGRPAPSEAGAPDKEGARFIDLNRPPDAAPTASLSALAPGSVPDSTPATAPSWAGTRLADPSVFAAPGLTLTR